ncbi:MULTISPECIES: CehA/McbA family metallohydrolase [unclassified Streptomyces]|uniref:CehA/McbA family metallohydrolase n=1 Tax=Streptomyces thermocoprophilus TaxID=78356 RepID=A0ABV5VD22_9ACTN
MTGRPGPPTLRRVSFASADGGERRTRTIRGTLTPDGPEMVYEPFEVPPGVREITVSYVYDRPPVPAGTPGNSLNIGLFDPRGTAPGGDGFRGWSGGARREFSVRADDATPGYLPGPLRPGTWHVALGAYGVAPQGMSYEITVVLGFGAPGEVREPVYPPERARGRGRAWYRGDLHMHSWHSDGRRTPAAIGAQARASGLDFINTSEHNTISGHAHWADVAGDDLLVLLGEEITTRNGHCLAVGVDPGTFVDWRYRARDGAFPRFAERIRRAGGLVVPAHPHAECRGCGWRFGYGEADAVEVWNGPYTPDDETALAAWDAMLVTAAAQGRRWLPAVSGSDAHRPPDRVGHPQTVVLADDLTRTAVLAGIRAGRCCVTESAKVELEFGVRDATGRTAGIGERLEAGPDAPVIARLAVTGAPRCTVRFVTDEGLAFASPPLPVSGRGVVEWRTTPARAVYVRAEVRHETAVGPVPGVMAGFTNPVWLGRW